MKDSKGKFLEKSDGIAKVKERLDRIRMRTQGIAEKAHTYKENKEKLVESMNKEWCAIAAFPPKSKERELLLQNLHVASHTGIAELVELAKWLLAKLNTSHSEGVLKLPIERSAKKEPHTSRNYNKVALAISYLYVTQKWPKHDLSDEENKLAFDTAKNFIEEQTQRLVKKNPHLRDQLTKVNVTSALEAIKQSKKGNSSIVLEHILQAWCDTKRIALPTVKPATFPTSKTNQQEIKVTLRNSFSTKVVTTKSFPATDRLEDVVDNFEGLLFQQDLRSKVPNKITKIHGLDCVAGSDITDDILKAYWEVVPYTTSKKAPKYRFVLGGTNTLVNEQNDHMTLDEVADREGKLTLEFTRITSPQTEKDTKYWLEPQSFAFVILDQGKHYDMVELRNTNPSIQRTGSFVVGWFSYAVGKKGYSLEV